jgi:hypothetical protein
MVNHTEACHNMQASCDSTWATFQLCSSVVNEALQNFASICQTGAKTCGFDFAQDTPPAQQASGQSIFWALATLALTAMAQESICAYTIRGIGDFDGTLVPHRSSPFVCFADALAEVFWMIHWRRNPPIKTGKDFDINRRKQIEDMCERLEGIVSLNLDEVYADSVHKHPNPYLPVYTREKRVVITMKLLLFVVGALPQAIKLFSMRGIAATQALAAIYFIALVVSLIRNLKHGPSKKNLDVLAFHVSNRNLLPKSRFRDTSVLLFGFTTWVAPLLHAVLMSFVWFQVAKTAHFTVPVSVANMMAVLNFMMMMFSMVGIGRTSFILLFRRRFSPTGYIFLAVGMTSCLTSLFMDQGIKTARLNYHTAPIAGAIMGFIVFASFLAALVLDHCAKWVVGSEEEENSVIADRLEKTDKAKIKPPMVEVKGSSNQEATTATEESSSSINQLSTAKSDGGNKKEMIVPSENVAVPDAIYFTPRIAPPDEETTLPVAVLVPTEWNTTVSSSPLVPHSRSKREIAALPFDAIFYPFAVINTFLHFGVGAFFRIMENINEETYWLAFAISNFVTAAIYYMLYFDGTGTMNPRWTTVLG